MTKLSDILKPFDVLQDIPKWNASRFLTKKGIALAPVQGIIIAKQHIQFRGVKCEGKNATHILMAADYDMTFEWTYPEAYLAYLDKLEGHHIRVMRFKGYEWTDADHRKLQKWFRMVLDDPKLRDYDEGEYLGHALSLALGESAVKLVGNKGSVCSSGATMSSVYVHKATGAPRFFRRAGPWRDCDFSYRPAEIITPADYSCDPAGEFVCVYDEKEARI